jgi:CRP-like cAMP-binding protein
LIPTPHERGEALVGAGAPGESRGPVRVARLLDEDPELGDGLGAGHLREAQAAARAVELTLPVGEWRPGTRLPAPAGGFGLLVLDGLLALRTRLGGRSAIELITGGDLLASAQRDDLLASMRSVERWAILEPCRIAVLDADFAARVSPFPSIASALVARALRRSRSLATNMAIVAQPKVEVRLHMLLWHLADRFGTVRRDGVLVTLRLTQSVLAELVAARRPTVSAALGTLVRDGRLTRMQGGWLLHGEPPGEPPRPG